MLDSELLNEVEGFDGSLEGAVRTAVKFQPYVAAVAANLRLQTPACIDTDTHTHLFEIV